MANDIEQKIIKQIEYYFGDINLPRDKFMQEKVKEDNGWIPLDVLLTFKRLANISTDAEVIINAIKKSESGLVDVSEDSKKLRRSPNKPLPELNEDRKKELMKRTAYAKGFPQEETLDEIIAFLESQGPIESCSKRTYLDKATKQHVFKGSCFIIFKDEETCKKFIEAESIKYKDAELIRKWQEKYLEEKKQEYEEKKNKRKKNKQEKINEETKEQKNKIEYPKGAILHFTGIKEDQVLTREEIKEKIKEIGEIETSFIDYNKGDLEGYVRMPEENSAVEFHKKLNDGEMEIGDIKLKVRVLEGEEEEEYLKKTAETVSKKRSQKKGYKKNNRKRGAPNDDESKAKKAKVK